VERLNRSLPFARSTLNVEERGYEFLIAARNFKASQLHKDDLKEQLRAELEAVADRLRTPCIITPFVTKAGFYAIELRPLTVEEHMKSGPEGLSTRGTGR